MKDLLAQLQWGRVVLFSVLIVIFIIILNSVLSLLASHVWSAPDQNQFASAVTAWGIYFLLLLLTFGGAVWIARTVEREPLLQGLLMGTLVGFIICILSMGFGSPILRSLLTLVLNMAAGYLGGFLGSRGR